MQFWEKVEAATSPLIAELRQKLASVPTTAVLNHYQLKHHLSQFKKDDFPDGFWAKWRFIWTLKLSMPFAEAPNQRDDERVFSGIDDLIEKVFDVYSLGAVYEPGRTPGSEKEFLSRLGLGLRVREPDALCFPEQAKDWALARLRPFNNSYFVPTFGLRFEEIYDWLDRLIAVMEARLNGWMKDMVAIFRDLDAIRKDFVAGGISAEVARSRAEQLKIGERLERNARDSDALHIFSRDDLLQGISNVSFDALAELFGIAPGEVGPDFMFPHHVSPLGERTFVVLPSGSLYFLDPAFAHRVLARTFERILLEDPKLRERYLANRGRAMENLVAESAKKVFPNAAIHRNYYLEKGSLEKDLFILHDRAVILIESKNSRVRTFRGASDDLIKFESDFDNSVQYGYEQAIEVKRRILTSEEATFFDSDGSAKFSLRRADVDRVYIICVSTVPRGPFGTNLFYELKKEDTEPFPLALGLFDFQTICKHFDADRFIEYLKAREQLHGRATTGDELNFAGYFLKFGHLNLQKGEFLMDDFSSFFDRKWYRERGAEVEEPPDQPVSTSMRRKGNRLYIEHSTGKKEVIRVPPWVVERTVGRSPIRMKGSDRNKRCPCGSGLKLKHCCGVD